MVVVDPPLSTGVLLMEEGETSLDVSILCSDGVQSSVQDNVAPAAECLNFILCNRNFGFLLQEILEVAVDVHDLSRVGAHYSVDVGRGDCGKKREPILGIQCGNRFVAFGSQGIVPGFHLCLHGRQTDQSRGRKRKIAGLEIQICKTQICLTFATAMASCWLNLWVDHLGIN